MGLHSPLPLHAPFKVELVALAHSENVQLVPTGGSEQAPLPSHRPVGPQLPVGEAGQLSRGSVSARTLPQTPSAPPLAPLFFCKQLWQVPLHALAQHTLSTQNPLAHSLLWLHAAPVCAKYSAYTKPVPLGFAPCQAPSKAALAEIATADPNPSLALPSPASSFCCWDQLLPLSANVYADPESLP